jgi:hypothetical protein
MQIRSLHLQAKCRAAQITSGGKGNWLHPEPMEVSFEQDKRFKSGSVSVFMLLQQ